MKLIPLSKTGKVNAGKYFAMVDDEDYEWLNQWSWCVDTSGSTMYAKRSIEKDGIKHSIKMHREIMGVTDPNTEVDHEDNNGLNCQHCNLRTSKGNGNKQNKTSARGSSSKYLGVTWYKRYSKWYAQIMIDKKNHSLGYYINEEDAARAYDKRATELFGEFANLNFK